MRIAWPFVAVLLCAASPGREPGVWVDVAASASFCREPFVAAIRQRRPDVAVHVGRSPGAEDVSATMSERRGVWSFAIHVQGLTPLRRTLPVPGRDCAATANIAALMLDRYLADVHWSGTPVRIEVPVPLIPLPAPDVAGLSTPELQPVAPAAAAPIEASLPPPVPVALSGAGITPVAAAVPVVAPPAAPPPPATRPEIREEPRSPASQPARTTVHAQAVIEVGPSVAATSLGAWPFFDADLSVRLGSWQVGFGGSVTATRQAPIAAATPAAGTYEVETGSVRLVAGYRFQLGPGAVRVELAPGAELLAASTSGGVLFHVQHGLAASPYVGLRVAYELTLPWRLALALRAEGRANLYPATFNVEGDSGSVSNLQWGGNLALALSRVFF